MSCNEDQVEEEAEGGAEGDGQWIIRFKSGRRRREETGFGVWGRGGVVDVIGILLGRVAK